MKELTVQEKAKAYDKALEKTKIALKQTESAVTAGILKGIFPELKESEDEKIKDMLYQLVRDRSDNRKLLEANGCPIEKALAWLERQCEQKPVGWSEEDLEFIDEAREYLMYLIGDKADFSPHKVLEGLVEFLDKLKSLRIQKQWKPSEEQMDALLVKIPIENSCNKVDNILKSLYSDLKRLK